MKITVIIVLMFVFMLGVTSFAIKLYEARIVYKEMTAKGYYLRFKFSDKTKKSKYYWSKIPSSNFEEQCVGE